MKNKIIKLVVSVLICQGAGIVGSFFTAPAIKTWYASLIKPSFNPPNWVFAPVWITLFLLMGVSLYLVWTKNWKIDVAEDQQQPGKFWNSFSEKLWVGEWKEENAKAIFILQLVLNILWSVLFFGLGMFSVAFVEILMLWVTILYTIVNFYRISKTAAFLLFPYIVWVTLAAVLNFSIFWLN